jgi:thioesterase domain-containing protein
MPGEKRLVAYVVAAQESEQDEAALAATCRAGLARRLPEYMLPAAYVVLKALPLTVNGKVDRKALPAPDPVQSDTAYVPPRTPTEQILADIWANVLGIGKVGVFDDFFALGGQSLLATQMVSRVKRALGVDLPLRALFEAPTIAALMLKMGHADTGALAPASSNLVPIRPQGDLTPLFLIHPIGGEVQYAVDLARHLDANQPVYALAASGLAEGERPHTDIREMASVYLKAIRQVQANGPYLLAGWSLGGMIAYEVAHQLLTAGEAVRFVGMIDTGSGPFHRSQWRAENIHAFDECMALMNWVIDLHPELADAQQHAAYAELMAAMERNDVETAIALCQREALLPPHMETALLRRMLAVYQAGANAAAAYDAPPAEMRVSFFAADRSEAEDPSLGWRDLLGDRLEVTRIGGSHWSIVRPPQLEKLAREIARRIRSRSPSGELSLA